MYIKSKQIVFRNKCSTFSSIPRSKPILSVRNDEWQEKNMKPETLGLPKCLVLSDSTSIFQRYSEKSIRWRRGRIVQIGFQSFALSRDSPHVCVKMWRENANHVRQSMPFGSFGKGEYQPGTGHSDIDAQVCKMQTKWWTLDMLVRP